MPSALDRLLAGGTPAPAQQPAAGASALDRLLAGPTGPDPDAWQPPSPYAEAEATQMRIREEDQMGPRALYDAFVSGLSLQPGSVNRLVNQQAERVPAGAAPVAPTLVTGVSQFGSGLMSLAQRATGFDDAADRTNRESQLLGMANERLRESTGRPDPLGVEAALPGAVRSLGMVAVAGPAGVPATIALQGASAANDAVTTGRDAGLSGNQLAAFAGTEGAIESLVTATVGKFTGRQGVEGLAQGVVASARELAKDLGIELGEEAAIALGSAINHKLQGVDPAALDPDRLAATMKDVLTQTVVTMGLGRTPQVVNGLMQEANQAATQRRLEAQERGMQTLAQAAAAAPSIPVAEPQMTDLLGTPLGRLLEKEAPTARPAPEPARSTADESTQMGDLFAYLPPEALSGDPEALAAGIAQAEQAQRQDRNQSPITDWGDAFIPRENLQTVGIAPAPVRSPDAPPIQTPPAPAPQLAEPAPVEVVAPVAVAPPAAPVAVDPPAPVAPVPVAPAPIAAAPAQTFAPGARVRVDDFEGVVEDTVDGALVVRTDDGEVMDVDPADAVAVETAPSAPTPGYTGPAVKVTDARSAKPLGEVVERAGTTQDQVIARTAAGQFVIGELPTRVAPSKQARGAVARVRDDQTFPTLEAARAEAERRSVARALPEDPLSPPRKIPAGMGEARLVRGNVEGGTTETGGRAGEEIQTRGEKVVSAAANHPDASVATEALELAAQAETAPDDQTRNALLAQAEEKLGLTTKAGRAAARMREKGIDPDDTPAVAMLGRSAPGRALVDRIANSLAQAVDDDLTVDRDPKVWIENFKDLKATIESDIADLVGSAAAAVFASAVDLDTFGADGKTVAKVPSTNAEKQLWADAAGRIQTALTETMTERAAEAAEIARLKAAVDPYPGDPEMTGPRGAQDGLTLAQRQAALDALATRLKVKVQHHTTQLSYRPPGAAQAVPVAALYDPRSNIVHLGPVTSLQDGVLRLVHETMHDEILRMPARDKAALFDATAEAFASPQDAASAVASVARTWKKLLDPENIQDAAYEEMLADAAAAALVLDHNSILARLPQGLAARIAGVLKRLGSAISKVVRGLPGLKSRAAQRARTNLLDIGERLLRARLDRVATEIAPNAGEIVLEQIAALNPDDVLGVSLEQALREGEQGGDLMEGIRRFVSKLPGATTASRVQAGAVALGALAFRQARKHPALDYVLRGIEEAGAAMRELIHGATSSQREFLALPKAAKMRVLQTGYAIRLYEIEQRREGKIPDPMRIEARIAAMPGPEQSALRGLWESSRALRETRRAAVAQALGFARPLSLEQVEVRLAELAKLGETDAVALERRRLEAWRSAETVFQAAKADYYLPLKRLRRDNMVTVTVGSGDAARVMHRQSARQADTAELVDSLQKDYPDAVVKAVPWAESEKVGQRSLEELTQQVRAAVESKAIADTDKDALTNLLNEVMPALFLDDYTASLQEARGTPGFDIDPQVITEHTNAVGYGVRAALTQAYTSAALDRLHQDIRKPALAKYARDLVYGATDLKSPALDAAMQAGRHIAYARVMMKPALAAANLISTYVMVPFQLGSLLGPLGATARATALVYWKTTSSLADALKRAPQEVWSAATGRSSSRLVEVAAAREAPALGDAMRDAERYGVFGDTEIQRQLEETRGGAGFIAKITRGVTFLEAVSNRIARIGTFVAAYKLAEDLDAAGWANVKREGYQGPQEAGEFARWATAYVQGQYGKTFRPPAFRSALGALPFQFASWVTNQTGLWLDMVGRMAKGGDRLGAAGAYSAMTGMGAMLFGVAGGIPFVGLAYQALMRLLNDEPPEDLMARWATEAADAGEHVEAGLWDIARGGLPQALARQGGVPGFIGERTKTLMDAAAPRNLALDVFSHPRVPVWESAKQVGAGVADIGAGISEENGESVARGFARILGPMGLRPMQAAQAVAGGGLTAPDIAEPGGYAPVVAGRDTLSGSDRLGVALDALMGQMPYKSVGEIRVRQAVRDASDTDRLPVDNRIDDVARAIARGQDPAKAISRLMAYVQERASTLSKAKTEGERARVMAEMAWLLGSKDPAQRLRDRIMGAVLEQKYGKVLPPGVRGGPIATQYPYIKLLREGYSGLEFGDNTEEDADFEE